MLGALQTKNVKPIPDAKIVNFKSLALHKNGFQSNFTVIQDYLGIKSIRPGSVHSAAHTMAPDLEIPAAAHRKAKAASNITAAETAAVKAKKGTKKQHSVGEGQKVPQEVVATQVPEPSPGKKKQKKGNKTEQPTIQLQAPVPSPLVQLVEIPGDVRKDRVKMNKKKQAMALRAAQGIRLENGELRRVEDASAKLSKKEQLSILGTSRKGSHARAKPVIPVRGSEAEGGADAEEEEDLLPVFRTFHPGGGRFLSIEPVFSSNEQFVARNSPYFCHSNLLIMLQIHIFGPPTCPSRLLYKNFPPKPYPQHPWQQP